MGSFSSTNTFSSGPSTPSPSLLRAALILLRIISVQPLPVLGIALIQVQDLVLGVTEIHHVGTGPPLSWNKMPLDVIPFLQCVECSTQLVDASQLAEGDLYPTVHKADKGVQQHQSQTNPLGISLIIGLHLDIDSLTIALLVPPSSQFHTC